MNAKLQKKINQLLDSDLFTDCDCTNENLIRISTCLSLTISCDVHLNILTKKLKNKYEGKYIEFRKLTKNANILPLLYIDYELTINPEYKKVLNPFETFCKKYGNIVNSSNVGIDEQEFQVTRYKKCKRYEEHVFEKSSGLDFPNVFASIKKQEDKIIVTFEDIEFINFCIHEHTHISKSLQYFLKSRKLFTDYKLLKKHNQWNEMDFYRLRRRMKNSLQNVMKLTFEHKNKIICLLKDNGIDIDHDLDILNVLYVGDLMFHKKIDFYVHYITIQNFFSISPICENDNLLTDARQQLLWDIDERRNMDKKAKDEQFFVSKNLILWFLYLMVDDDNRRIEIFELLNKELHTIMSSLEQEILQEAETQDIDEITYSANFFKDMEVRTIIENLHILDTQSLCTVVKNENGFFKYLGLYDPGLSRERHNKLQSICSNLLTNEREEMTNEL